MMNLPFKISRLDVMLGEMGNDLVGPQEIIIGHLLTVPSSAILPV
jgi:hypothetical protein